MGREFRPDAASGRSVPPISTPRPRRPARRRRPIGSHPVVLVVGHGAGQDRGADARRRGSRALSARR
ncbi:MAG: hypothetical protein AVDCRST_MAG49-718 [uncultured Thermomicrobiales bacterium]|uniref:Uncharacterized protein n=1 Tax=uncultured Thermomicrobiales bacterium TaxID=1645740 RepID=A0A6J4U372_9BACT|nr:MAG: hypothetical protein AVDCRST_MAG49-718 [uncultured Thermomicrobiales bacterium]